MNIFEARSEIMALPNRIRPAAGTIYSGPWSLGTYFVLQESHVLVKHCRVDDRRKDSPNSVAVERRDMLRMRTCRVCRKVLGVVLLHHLSKVEERVPANPNPKRVSAAPLFKYPFSSSVAKCTLLHEANVLRV